MLDTYTTGSVERISPEAPVPILHVKETESLPGGAGNVALNLRSLGAKVTCMGRVGPDIEGKQLKSLLEEEDIDTKGLFVQRKTRTPVKNRLIAESQQLMRVDDETLIPISASIEAEAISLLRDELEQIEVIAVSDYRKGFLSKRLLDFLIKEGNRRSIPVLVDPKGDDFACYKKATLIKPNLKEAKIAAKLGSDASLDAIGREIIRMTQAEHLVITRSELGMTFFDQNCRVDFPVKSREVIDVTGAGDTVLSVMAMAYAAKLDLSVALQLANIAAGIAIECVGCARVSLSDIGERLLEIDVANKIFDESHLFAIEQVLRHKKFIILGLSAEKGLSLSLFAKIRDLSHSHVDEKLIIYLMDREVDEEFVSLLSSLHEVDFVIVQSDNLFTLCRQIHPAYVYTLEGDQIFLVGDPGDLVNRGVPYDHSSLHR